MRTSEKNGHKVKKILEGVVVSDKMHKTVVVCVTYKFKHSLLGKIVNHSKRYKVHDEKNEAKVGDKVEIIECRPLSKTKHMRLLCVVGDRAGVSS